MRRFPFKKIDAFTGPGSTGNPAACIYTSEALPDPVMLRIARELKGFVSEVVYCRPLESGDSPAYDLRYFSAECEVEFCGHATVACLYDVVTGRPELAARREIAIRTRKGELAVHNRLAEADAVFVAAPRAEWKGMPLPPAAVAEALGMPEGWLDPSLPVARINAGLDTLIVPLDSLAHVVALRPDIERLGEFCLAAGADIVAVLSTQVADPARAVRTRVFAPKYGYLEDPATGSGNAAVGAYLLRQGGWRGEPVAVEQGPSVEAPNIVRLEASPDPPDSPRILFGGRATVRIEGEYLLP